MAWVAVVECSMLPFEAESAFQGEDAFSNVQHAVQQERPYAMAFVDVRMPPGWDGAETTSRSGECHPNHRSSFDCLF